MSTFDKLFGPNENYPYFQKATSHPFVPESPGFDIVKAGWLADCALLVYVNGPKDNPGAFVENILKSRAGLKHAKALHFDRKGPQAFVAHDGESRAIVSFRGTEVHEPADLLADLDIRPSQQPGDGGKVHGGFSSYTEELSQEIKEHLEDFPNDQPVWYTGHSLGAAMATVAAARHAGPRGLYTFGSPRVGDLDFQSSMSIDSKLIASYRFVNNCDTVTTVPPEEFGYKHLLGLRYFDNDGAMFEHYDYWAACKEAIERKIQLRLEAMDIKSANSPMNFLRASFGVEDAIPELLADHSPTTYAENVWKQL